MMLDEQIAKVQQGAKAYQQQRESKSPSLTAANPRDALFTAHEIIKRDKLNREAAEGCMKQIIQDLDNGDRDYQKFLLYAAEALDRATGGGDGYFKWLEYHLEQAGLRD